MKPTVAIIGGTGLYALGELEDCAEQNVVTPFGKPSDTITIGTLRGVRVAFLPRHGKHHQHLPSEIPVQANIWALKSLGVTQLISVTAVGSLQQEMAPLHFVVPDQIIDRTQNRTTTFFGKGISVHVAFGDPFCPALRQALCQAGKRLSIAIHSSGTLVVIEGPQFSTRAESELFRSWGGDVINMTTLPEAKLAREAELCYATVACVTDYDVWHETEEDVSADLVIKNLRSNAESATKLLLSAIGTLPTTACPCQAALNGAVLTPKEQIPKEARARLAPILERFLG